MKQIAVLMVLAFATVTGMAAVTVAEATASSQASAVDVPGN